PGGLAAEVRPSLNDAVSDPWSGRRRATRCPATRCLTPREAFFRSCAEKPGSNRGLTSEVRPPLETRWFVRRIPAFSVPAVAADQAGSKVLATPGACLLWCNAVEFRSTSPGKSGALLRFPADRRSLGLLTVYAALVITAWVVVPDGPLQAVVIPVLG